MGLWTEAELERLRSAYVGAGASEKALGLDELAAELGRHKSNVCRKARQLGLTNQHRVDPRKDRRKFKGDTEALRQHQSNVSRERLQQRGHPRGALGLRHSEETKAVIAERSRAMNARRTPEEVRAMARKATMTKIEKYGTAGPVYANEGNAYSRTVGGRRADLDNRYFRSMWEANYARYLNWLVEQGEIQGWEYEADTFVFHGETRGAITYRPDFKVTEKDGEVVYHEVKGWMDGLSKTRLKRMKKHYPEVKVIVIGEAEYKAVSKWKGLIPNWESKRN